jgi:hypothetical protein
LALQSLWESILSGNTIPLGDHRPKRDAMSIEEATVSNMWEIAAIAEVLERKGLCRKQDLYDIITEFRRKNSRASIPEIASLSRIFSPRPRIRSLTTFSHCSTRMG